MRALHLMPGPILIVPRVKIVSSGACYLTQKGLNKRITPTRPQMGQMLPPRIVLCFRAQHKLEFHECISTGQELQIQITSDHLGTLYPRFTWSPSCSLHNLCSPWCCLGGWPAYVHDAAHGECLSVHAPSHGQ